jgi:aspartate aminotransferase
MPHISFKGRLMPESPIRKLVPFAEAAVKEGKRVYYLNIGQPDIHTPKEAIEAVQNIAMNTLEYSHSAGYESLRIKMVAYYKKRRDRHQSGRHIGDYRWV